MPHAATGDATSQQAFDGLCHTHHNHVLPMRHEDVDTLNLQQWVQQHALAATALMVASAASGGRGSTCIHSGPSQVACSIGLAAAAVFLGNQHPQASTYSIH